MADLSNRIEELGAEIVVAVPEGPDMARQVQEILDTPFPIWAGETGTVHEAYGLNRVWLRLVQRSGTVVIADGLVRYVQLATDPRQALDPSILLEELEALAPSES